MKTIDRVKQSESEKFDDVMRKILTVSKDELKKREKAWRRKRERAKKKRAISLPAVLDLAAERPVSG
jgi:hypothetical protein